MTTALSLPFVVILGAVAAAGLGVFVAFRLIGLAFWVAGLSLMFVTHSARDLLQLVASTLSCVAFVPLILLQVVLGRWSAARHWGGKLETEGLRAGRSLYQLAFGNLIETLEARRNHRRAAYDADGGLRPDLPPPAGAVAKAPKRHRLLKRRAAKAAVARVGAPGRDKPKRGRGFDGFQVVGSLPTGGSGAKLYVAEPDADKQQEFARAGHPVPAQVVIKCFGLDEGSNLSQIVRESRALESAKKMGMVLEHGLDERRYYYVMPYVPGESLSAVVQRMHAKAGPKGLGNKQIKESLGYLADLLTTLDRFHCGGLWHKDIKPDNIIVRNGRAHLVDLGLVTPLSSALTLTTHGTEYYRDPELVRQALRGAKVHEVDGARFDLYGAGAVLFSMIEDSFPAHGSLSRVSKNCPETVAWIIRRSMADLNQRYANAAEMAADVRRVQFADDLFALRPADLPSMGGQAVNPAVVPPPPLPPTGKAAPGTLLPIPESFEALPGPAYREGPVTAAYAAAAGATLPPPVPGSARAHARAAALQAREAARQAREAARQARQNAKRHIAEKRAYLVGKKAQLRERGGCFTSNPNRGVWVALAFVVLLVAGAFTAVREHRSSQWGNGVIFSSSESAQSTRVIEVGRDGPRVHSGMTSAEASSVLSAPEFDGEGWGFALKFLQSEGLEVALTGGVQPRHPRSAAALTNGRGEDSGRILIIDDLSFRTEEEKAQVVGLAEVLTQQGFELEGAPDAPLASTGLEVIATARASMGVYTPVDESAREALRKVLLGQPGYDALLWIGRKAPSEKGVAVYILHQHDFNADRLHQILQPVER